MKIAAYLDADRQPVSLYQPGTLHLYEGAESTWSVSHTVPLATSGHLSIGLAKQLLRDAVTQLDGCQILLSGEVSGLLYSILQEEMGFHTWKSHGALDEQLSNVYQMEQIIEQRRHREAGKEENAAPCQGRPARHQTDTPAGGRGLEPEVVGPASAGHFKIDLKALLESDRDLNSRGILMPMLDALSFKQFDIYCDHEPRWLERKLAERSLSSMTESLDDSGHWIKIILFPIANTH